MSPPGLVNEKSGIVPGRLAFAPLGEPPTISLPGYIRAPVRYDLLIQSPDPQTPYDHEAVEKVLATKQLKVNADGSRLWQLKAGDIEIRPLSEGGKIIATELRVPLSDKLELIREVVLEGVSVASEAKQRLFDPQLSRALTPADDSAVADQFFRTAKYAGEMLGVSSAIGASFAPPKQGMSAGTKVLLGLIALAILVYFLTSQLMGAIARSGAP